MKLLRQFPVLAFALVLLSIVGLCMAQRSVGLLLLAGSLAAISWYITEGPRGRILPRWVSNILVIGASLNVFRDLLQNQNDVMGVLGRFAVLLTLIKLYERRTARDYAHLLTLSLLLILTACLQTNDLLFGILVIVYAVLGLYVLLLYQLYASFEKARDERQAAIPADYRLVPPLKPIIGRQTTWRLRSQALGIAVAGIAVSALVFLSFPRGVGADMFGMLNIPSSNRESLFSWDMDLNIGGLITESRAKVMDLRLTDLEGNAVRMNDPILLRGTVLDQYLGKGRWDTRPRNMMPQIPPSGQERTSIVGSLKNPGRPLVQHIFLNQPADGRTPIFSMYAPTSVWVDGPFALQYNPATQIIRTDEDAWRLMNYTVVADPEISDNDLSFLAGPVRFTSAISFSAEDKAALRSLADSKLVAAGVPLDRPTEPGEVWKWNKSVASVLTDYLQSGEFVYTLDLSSVVYPNADVDPIVRFLTVTRRGHCEFFASALAALCHSKGIPARVVAGYIVYDYDEALEQYSVLACNAHAWAEIATGSHRWSTFDPTPPATLMAFNDSQATLADQVRWAYQRFEGNWSSSIVNFNGSSQTQLAQSLNRTWSARLSSALGSVRDWMHRVNQSFNFGPAGYIWMGIVGFALVIAVIALVKLMRRTVSLRRALRLQHMRGAEYQRMLRHLGFYLDMLGTLRRAGFAKPDWQPPLAFAAELAQRNRHAADLVREITDLFYEVRYGQQKLQSREVNGAHTLVRQLEEALHATPRPNHN